MKEKEADSDVLREIAKKHKLKLLVLYTYNLKKEPKSKAVRFVYALKGRGKEEGIVARLNGKFLAPGCFIVPIKSDKEIQEVFKLWRIKFARRLMLTN
jgi:hypothetical protein